MRMYLEEIILDGFKSYATRTVISGFDPKFNAITGLNGSGKSNILDAICFVLGITNLSQVGGVGDWRRRLTRSVGAREESKNVDRITKYAKAIDTAILVKNGPSYAALGFGGEGFCTFTIASRTGEGLTSASSFTKRRRCVMTDSLCIR